MSNELQILQKVYDMILYGNTCLRQFPNYEKHVMTAEIRSTMYELLRLIIRANKRYYKKTTQQEIDIALEELRVMIRLASDPGMKYLSLRKYEIWAKQLNEIGRMLGGWMKATK